MVAEGVDMDRNVFDDILNNYGCFENDPKALISKKCCLPFHLRTKTFNQFVRDKLCTPDSNISSIFDTVNPQGYGGFFIHLGSEKEITLNFTAK